MFIMMKEMTEILKYTFAKARQGRPTFYVGKREIENIRRIIGFPSPYFPMSLVTETMIEAGFTSTLRVSDVFDYWYPCAKFNLQRIVPPEIADLIIEFAGVPRSNTFCTVCKDEFHTNTALVKHMKTRAHKTRTSSIDVPVYLK